MIDLGKLLELIRAGQLTGFGLLVILLSSFFIEIIPQIKFNPLSAMLHWVGKRLNKDTNEKVESLMNSFNDHIRDDTLRRANDLRGTILMFSNECQRGINHSQEHYRFMMSMCKEYHQYMEKNHLENGVIDQAIALIESRYQEHLKKNDFLK